MYNIYSLPLPYTHCGVSHWQNRLRYMQLNCITAPLCTTFHCTLLHYITLNTSTALDCNTLHVAIQCTTLCTTMHYTLHYNAIHFVLQCTTLCTTMQYTALICPLHSTVLVYRHGKERFLTQTRF